MIHLLPFFSFTQERRCYIYQSSQFEIEADLILASFLDLFIKLHKWQL